MHNETFLKLKSTYSVISLFHYSIFRVFWSPWLPLEVPLVLALQESTLLSYDFILTTAYHQPTKINVTKSRKMVTNHTFLFHYIYYCNMNSIAFSTLFHIITWNLMLKLSKLCNKYSGNTYALVEIQLNICRNTMDFMCDLEPFSEIRSQMASLSDVTFPCQTIIIDGAWYLRITKDFLERKRYQNRQNGIKILLLYSTHP